MKNEEPKNKELATLLTDLKHADSPAARAVLCNRLAFYYRRTSDYEQAERYALEGLMHSRLANDKSQEISALRVLGITSYFHNNFAEALEYFQQSLVIAESQETSFLQTGILLSIANVYFQIGAFEKSLEYVFRGLDIIDRATDRNIIALHTAAGKAYFKMANIEQAYEHFHQSLKFCEKFQEELFMPSTLVNFGNFYFYLGDFTDALECFTRSLPIAEKLKNQEDAANALNNIANVYFQLNDFEQALHYHHRALEVRKTIGDQFGMANSLVNIATTLCQLDRLPEASTALEESRELYAIIGSEYEMGKFFSAEGEIYLRQKDYAKTLLAFFRSLQLYKNFDEKTLVTTLKNRISEVYIAIALHAPESVPSIHQNLLKNGIEYPFPKGFSAFDCALEYLDDALEYGKTMKAKPLMLEAHKGKYELYKINGNFELALEHYEKYNAIEKEIYNEKLANTAKIYAVKLQVAELEQKHRIARLDNEIYRLRTIELATANEQLQAMNVEKNELLGIVAHDLKNPLGNIKMITEILEKNEEVTDAERNTFLNDILTSTERMFGIVSALLDTNALEQGKMAITPEYVNIIALCANILGNYSAKANKKHITLISNLESAPVFAFVDPNITLQVLDNLLSNAIKFSTPEKKIHFSVDFIPNPV